MVHPFFVERAHLINVFEIASTDRGPLTLTLSPILGERGWLRQQNYAILSNRLLNMIMTESEIIVSVTEIH
jgi:hypothetical protein